MSSNYDPAEVEPVGPPPPGLNRQAAIDAGLDPGAVEGVLRQPGVNRQATAAGKFYDPSEVEPADTAAPSRPGMGDLLRGDQPAMRSMTPGTVANVARARLGVTGLARSRAAAQFDPAAANAMEIENPAAAKFMRERAGATGPEEQANEVLGTPLVPLGEMARKARGARPPNVLDRFGEGVADKVGGMTSLEGVSQLGIATAVPPIGLAYVPGMAKDALSEVGQGIQSLKKGDLGGAAEHAGGALVSGAGVAAAAAHVAKSSGALEPFDFSDLKGAAGEGLNESMRRPVGATPPPLDLGEMPAEAPPPGRALAPPQAPPQAVYSEPVGPGRPSEPAVAAPVPREDLSALRLPSDEEYGLSQIQLEPREGDITPEQIRNYRPDEVEPVVESGRGPTAGSPRTEEAFPGIQESRQEGARVARAEGVPETPPRFPKPEQDEVGAEPPRASDAVRLSPEELDSVRSIAQESGGRLSEADLPGDLRDKIALRANLEDLADVLQGSKGTVGRWRTERGQGGGFDWTGQKSPLPKELQQGFSYDQIRSIIRKALSGEELTPRQENFFADLVRNAQRKPLSLSPDSLERFVADQGVGEGVERRGAMEGGRRSPVPPEDFEKIPELERRDVYRREYDRARTDPLTGIGNRLAYTEHQGRFPGLPEAAIDLADFKKLNDTVGHANGDHALQTVASFLKEIPDAAVFRTGGDEFALRAQDAAGMERHLRSLQQYFDENGKGVRFDYGIGETPEAADAASYINKRARKEVLREAPTDAERGPDRNPTPVEAGERATAEPISEFSPEASERQRTAEEADAVAARQREAEARAKQEKFEARPKGPTDQTNLFGREDRGRPLDQRDLELETETKPRVAREGAGRIDRSAFEERAAGEALPRDIEERVSTRKPLASAQEAGKAISDLLSGRAEKRMQRTIGEGELRSMLASVDMYKQRAQALLADALKWGAKLKPEDGNEFIRRVETGQKQATPEAQRYADIADRILSDQKLRVQALGRLRQFYENYWPHIWAEPKKAAMVAAQFFGKRPLAGAKSFLKQRTHITFQDGLDAGLKPAFANPFESVIAKAVEMERFIQYQQLLKRGRQEGFVKTLPVDYNGPAGWKKIPNGEVYGDTKVKINEVVDRQLFNRLNSLAEDLGVRTARKPTNRQPIGWAEAPDKIFTRFASPMGTLAHELGHHLEWKFGLWDDLHTPEPGTPGTKVAARRYRVEIDKELRALADLRDEKIEGGGNEDVSQSRRSYVRNRDEKMANVVDAWVTARQKMENVAPNVAKAFDRFLDNHPELAPLKEMGPSLTRQQNNAMVGPQGRLQVAQHWAPAPIADLMEKHLSPGLRGNVLYDGFRFVGNSMNQAQLGLSAFHATAETINSMASDVGMGAGQILRGKLLPGLGHILQGATPLSIVPKLARADRLVRSLGKETLPPEIQAAVDNVVRAGGRLSMDQQFVNGALKKMRDAWQRGVPQGIASSWRLPFAAVEAASHPIMGWLVPRVKVGAFLDMAKDTLQRLGPGATEHELQYHLGRDWDSIENRMGQLTYDNVFVHNAVKDLAFLGIRAVGWDFGTLREGVGAVKDVATLPGRALGAMRDARRQIGAPEGEAPPLGMKRIEVNGREVFVPENFRDPAITRRMEYVFGLPVVVGLYGALYQAMRTGKSPDRALDYFAPRTGKMNPDGSEERKMLPSYVKDYESLREQGPLRYAASKLHPLPVTLFEMMANRTYNGVEIRHAEDPKMQQALDTFNHFAKAHLPISVRNFQKSREAGESMASALEAAGGITPAPGYVSRSPAMREMYDWNRAHMPAAARTKEDFEHSQSRRQVENFIRHQDIPGARDALRSGVAAGKLTDSDFDTIARRSQRTVAQNMFGGMPLEEKLKVWNVAEPTERDGLREMLADSIQKTIDRGQFEELRPAQQERVRAGLRKAIAADDRLRAVLETQ